MESYKLINKRLSLSENTSTHQPSEVTERSITCFSSDPLESDIAPMIISTSSISHLNELIGMPDNCDDIHIEYPPSLSELMSSKYLEINDIRSFLHSLTSEDKKIIQIASLAYLMGDSQKVKEYEPIINATNFPGKVAYFSSPEELIISGEVIIKGEDPIIWNYGNITLKENGVIKVQAPMIISASSFDCDNVDGNYIHIKVPDYQHKAANGIKGSKGADGVIIKQDFHHHSETEFEEKIKQSSILMGNGGKGGTGGDGKNGKKGLPQPPFIMTINGIISGNLLISASGGNGQDGGQGGDGGDGGIGSTQGDGGNGGIGGKSGDGGDGGVVRITYHLLLGKIDVTNKKSLSGNPGLGGIGGKGKVIGENGKQGKKGNSGSKSEIIIEPISHLI